MVDRKMLDIPGMRQLASRFRNEASTVEQVISTMNSLVTNLDATYRSDTAEQFKQKYEGELKPNFQKAKEEIESIAQFLDNEANRYENM